MRTFCTCMICKVCEVQPDFNKPWVQDAINIIICLRWQEIVVRGNGAEYKFSVKKFVFPMSLSKN